MNKVWTWLKDGQPKGFFESERSLLISYDMMPLRGLDNARDDLNREGRIATGRLVEGKSDPPLLVPFRNGVADVGAIDWGCGDEARDHCMRSLCFYVSFPPANPRRNKFNISEGDNQILNEFFWRGVLRDGRQRRTLARLKPVVGAILAGLGFEVKSAKFVEAI